MLKNNTNSGSDDIVWETVRNKKVKDKPAVKHQSPKLDNVELNENYVPRGLRENIDNILYSSESVGEKIRELNKKVNTYCSYKKSNNPENIDWRKRLNIYIIHKSCKKNYHEIIASIIDNIPDYKMYSNAVSSTLSGNTCLFDAAYYGSDQCMNYLINRDADIHHKNKAGETIYDLIEIGMKDAKERYPNAKQLVEARFNECIRLVKQAEENEKLPKEVVVVETPKNEFSDNYEFESLKSDLLKYVDTPDKCRKFIKYLKDNDYSMLLTRVLEDEDMEDVLIDNPYLVKIV
jgi:ankyrin repeat protein